MNVRRRIVFAYQSNLVYLGYAASGVTTNTESANADYPWFLLDVQRIYPAGGTIQDFEQAMREKGLLQKNIANTQGWPTLEDSPELDKIWQSFRAV